MQEVVEAIVRSQGFMYGVFIVACQLFLIIFFIHEAKRKEKKIYNYIDKRIATHGLAVSNAIEANHVSAEAILTEEELQMLLSDNTESFIEPSNLPCEMLHFGSVKEKKKDMTEEDELLEELLSEILSC